jgi:hypothetical protein
LIFNTSNAGRTSKKDRGITSLFEKAERSLGWRDIIREQREEWVVCERYAGIGSCVNGIKRRN